MHNQYIHVVGRALGFLVCLAQALALTNLKSSFALVSIDTYMYVEKQVTHTNTHGKNSTTQHTTRTTHAYMYVIRIVYRQVLY